MKILNLDFWISGKILGKILVCDVFESYGKPQLLLSQHTFQPPIYEVKINVEFGFVLLINPH